MPQGPEDQKNFSTIDQDIFVVKFIVVLDYEKLTILHLIYKVKRKNDRAICLLWNKNFCLDTPRTDRTDSTDGKLREYGIS